MAQIGLDLETFRQTTGNMDGTYVRGPGGDHAIPAVMTRKFIGETAMKVVSLSHIYRVPAPEVRAPAEDVGAGDGVVSGADRVVVEFVSLPRGPRPDDDGIVGR